MNELFNFNVLWYHSYKSTIGLSHYHFFLKNKDVFDLALVNCYDPRTDLSASNQTLGACFNPYRAFFNLQTCLRWAGSSNPSPLRKALFVTVRLKINIITAVFTTGIKVSW